MAADSILARSQTNLVFDSAGRVSDVLVKPGDVITKGQVLMRLVSTDQEVAVAKAKLSLATAQNQLKKLKEGATTADIAAAKSAVETAKENLTRVKAGPTQAELTAAEAAVLTAQQAYNTLVNGPDADTLAQAQARLEQAQNSLWSTQLGRDAAGGRLGQPGGQLSYDQARASVANAEISVKLAQMDLDKLKVPASVADLTSGRAKLQQAQETLAELKTKPTAADIAAAEAQLAQAQSKLDTLQSGATEEDLAISGASVEQARLSLEQAQKQLDGALLLAPYDSTVLKVAPNAGEMVGTSTVAVVVGDLTGVEIKVPLSEVDVARVKAGQDGDGDR